MGTHVVTKNGKSVEIISEGEIANAIERGGRLRTYCPIHGGDHQRSLSIDPTTGWGHCFNAACKATVLVQEFNPEVAERLLQRKHAATEPSGSPLPRSSALAGSTPSSARCWQRDEVATLCSHDGLMRQALADYQLGDCWQVLAYLETRGIPLELAQEQGLGYLSHELLKLPAAQPHQALLQRWAERIVFPLRAPTGNGYIGRSLWRWQLHMDEHVHKAILEEPGSHKRWIKTNPAGWFCAPPVDFGDRIIVVEGPFDRMALLAAGFSPKEVVALVGTALDPGWLPEQVRHIVLALDGDAGGIEAMWRIVDLLPEDEYNVSLCPPPEDQRGKDWSERWKRHGVDGLAELLRTVDLIASSRREEAQ